MLMLAAALVASLQAAQGSALDTTFAVTKGARLEASVFSGSVTVKAWNRDQVRIVSDVPVKRGGRDNYYRGGLDLRQSAGAVRLGVHPGGDYESAILTITVPAATAVELTGVETSFTVEGIAGPVEISTVEGDVTATGGSGEVSASSIEGDVVVSGVRGRLDASSVDGDVRVRDVATGPVNVTTVDGGIDLENVNATRVEANTVDGDVYFSGQLQAGGDYRLQSHDGDISAAVGQNPNVQVSVSTYDGDFSSDMPVTVSGSIKGGREFSFTLGSGAARLSLESFDGTIRLVRTGR
ncbi:MAG: DUF4097 family beta strand repeat-containing protein [Gemmatimonadales bacterium]